MSQPASGFLEMLGSVAQALSPFKVRAPPTPLRCLGAVVGCERPYEGSIEDLPEEAAMRHSVEV